MNALSADVKPKYLGLLLLLGACGSLILFFFNSSWVASVDLAHHYALVARIAEYWRLPATPDPSLGEMQVYPRAAHLLAALVGTLFGSPLEGMQFVSLLALVSLWSGIAFCLLSLPAERLWTLFCASTILLLANRFFIHLELFGNELLENFFFAQIVAQAAAMGVIAAVLYMERRRVSPVLRYFVLGGSAPILEQIHPIAALEVLALLALMIVVDLLDKEEHGRGIFLLGLAIACAALLITVVNPTFRAILKIAENNGGLRLRYTPDPTTLAVEAAIVIVVSALVLLQWIHLDRIETKIEFLVLKYMALLGIAIACLCLLQIVALQFGRGSVYACKKYAFGLNTLLVIDLSLLAMLFLWTLLPASHRTLPQSFVSLSQHAFLALFVVSAVFAIMPPPASKVLALTDILPGEQFALKYRYWQPMTRPGKYDYAIGLFGSQQGLLDDMITIGALKAPLSADTNDIRYNRPPSQPRTVGRIFTRVGAKPWDIPECRELVTQDGFVILGGPCVFKNLKTALP